MHTYTKVQLFLKHDFNYQFKTSIRINYISGRISKLLDQILGTKVLEFTVIYVDDIHLALQDFKQHLEHLSKIFECFRLNSVIINLEKKEE